MSLTGGVGVVGGGVMGGNLGAGGTMDLAGGMLTVTGGVSGAGGADVTGGTSGAGGLADTGGVSSTGSTSGMIDASSGVPDCGATAIAGGQLPATLSCTGLYSDIASKTIAAGVREYKPAHLLWSDGAEKTRWVYLPSGTVIDNSNADAWKFPVGTRFFKEFIWNGQRVETRVFWKTSDTLWLKTTYHWNADESEADRFDGGEVNVTGGTYYIPTAKECDQCHKGRADRALGFEHVLLTLPGATGLNAQALSSEGLLAQSIADSSYAIGDDGTGKAAAALAYLHVNCGVSCHNGYSASEGYSTGMRLRLPPEAINGGSVSGFESITTTVGIAAKTPRWNTETRIVPGSPSTSLIYKLMALRDPNTPKDQMPPVGSRVADSVGIAAVQDWIASLPP